MSIDILYKKIQEKGNPTAVGLDPKLDYIPDGIIGAAFAEKGRSLEGAAEAIWRFNKALIDAVCDIVPAVKPQSAYYEMYGWAGVRAFEKTINYAKEKGLYVIADAKRNDIGTTAEAYARAFLGRTELGEGVSQSAFNADAVTVNGYLGSDGIKPFLDCGKSVFVLVKTSNPSSGELQDQKIDGKTVFEKMGGLVDEWGRDFIGSCGYSNAGAVVGATYPRQLAFLREKMPRTFFLVPGYGAQGGKAGDVACAFDKNGAGAVINASRSILCAYQKEGGDFAAAARNEALRMRDELRRSIR